ncbi:MULTISPECIES: hypothetical protein [unclassified Pseudoalteromonas]|uniref:hypothetical protein n=1 Tax=unclassified Pseudoalteromonas TaxID=194690 RepID=UPI001E3C64B5|nr:MULTISPECIES: hypothetical protein [unclassified Pseudoalteromonas]
MIFYLPIYKDTKDEFEAYIKSLISKQIDELATPEMGGIVSPRIQSNIADRLQREYGRSWELNRAKGWLKVSLGKKGFIFSMAKADNHKTRKPKKYFELMLPEQTHGSWHVIDFSKCKTADDVMSKFESIFTSIVNDGLFKGCYVDDSQIRSIYKFIDWPTLIASKL